MKSEGAVISDEVYSHAMKPDEATRITESIFTAYINQVGGAYPMTKDGATQLAGVVTAFRSRLLQPRSE